MDKLHPAERRLEFPCAAAEGLYRDRSGRWVIADADGPALAWTESSAAEPIVIPDGQAWSPTDREVAGSRIVTLLGRTAMPTGVSTAVDLPYEGAGWIVDALEDVTIDDDPRPVKAGGLPTPFFRRIGGAGRATVLPAETSGRELLRVTADSPGALPEYAARGVSRVVTTEGRWVADGPIESRPVVSHMNALSFRVEVPPDATGLRIERVYDQFHGRQRARVLINGRFAAWWYDPREDRIARWSASSSGATLLPEDAREPVTITIDPPAGVALWTWCELRVFALSP
ncbi:MAG: hypothetical protein SFX74_00590 [Fimbriimonadaceae bacterium]|nr:hypothetical protein [Fimbriimonadaceae bacterium]